MFVFLLSAGEARLLAQQTTRAKIGLALGGGAARGFAHIGVLEWFEDHHIPVDFIGGTSIGGLIGGLYAMGMKPAEMRLLIAGLDWDKLMSGAPGYNELSFRRKEDRLAYPALLEFGLRGGFRLPRAVNPAHYIGLTFDRLTLPYSIVTDFNALPIPFGCVATDMLSAEPRIIKDGSLSQALRATMAIPGLFTPAEINGRILTDGGLLNNIPTDVVKEMGADIVIAVNVGAPLGTREDMETLPGMLGQVISVSMVEGERRGLKLANIVIAPDLGNHTKFDFTAADKIADLGRKGAESKASELEKLALDDAAWQQHLAARGARMKAAVPTPAGLDVVGVEEGKAAEIRQDLIQFEGRPIDSARLERRLSEIRGRGRYESLGYEIVQVERESRLRIRTREKTYGPPFITPVLQVQSHTTGDVSFSAGFRMTDFDLSVRNSEMRYDVVGGSSKFFGAEYYHPIGQSGLFIAPRASYDSVRVNLYADGRRSAQYLTRSASAALNLGYTGQNFQLRTGYQFGDLRANVDVGAPLLPELDGPFSAAAARFVYDQQNSAVVPTRGVRATAELVWYFRSPGAPRAFPKAELSVSIYRPVVQKGAWFAYVSGGTTFNSVPGPAQQFTLGGPLRLSAYGLDEFRGNRYVLGGAGYRHQLLSLPTLLGGKVYAAAWLERGSAFFRSSEARYLNDVAGGLILETILGPLTFGGAWGEGGKGKIFFSFGKVFWKQNVSGNALKSNHP